MTEPRLKPSEVAHRTARNSLFSFAAFAVTAAFVAVTTPIIFHHLGAEQYGIFSLSLTIVNFLALLDGGISTALVRFVADREAVGDDRGLNRLVSASLAVYVAAGLVAVVGTTLVAAVLTDELFNLTPSAVGAARFAFAVAGVAFFFTFVAKIFGAVILGVQRNDLSAVLKIAVTSATGIGTVILVEIGYGVRALVALSAVVAAVGLFGYWTGARRVVPSLRVWTRPDTLAMLATLRFSGWIFVANTTAFLLFQLDRIFLGALKNVSLVTFYAVPGSVASYLYVAAANLAAITIAVATRLFAREQWERAAQLYLRATRFVVVFLLAFAVPAFVLAHPILRYWIGAAFADRSVGAFRLLIATHLVLGLCVVSYNIVLAAGRPRILGLFNLGACVANVALILILVPTWGLIGAAWAYLISVLPLLLLLVYAERRLLGITSTHWPRLAARLALPAAIATATAFGTLYVAGNLAVVLVGAAASALLLAGTYICCFAPQEDRELVLSLAQTRRAGHLA